jgi:hypothetical protein
MPSHWPLGLAATVSGTFSSARYGPFRESLQAASPSRSFLALDTSTLSGMADSCSAGLAAVGGPAFCPRPTTATSAATRIAGIADAGSVIVNIGFNGAGDDRRVEPDVKIKLS